MPTAAKIYLDNAATTPLDRRVLDAMMPCLGERFGNPSSLHSDGRAAKEIIEEARLKVARMINADSREIFFTSSGTEASNIAIFGVAEAYAPKGGRIVTSAFEHPAVLEPCRQLEKKGYEVICLRPDSDGIVRAESLREVVQGAFLVSIMSANNVVGTVQPVGELGQIAHAAGALFHTDAVQAAGKIPLNMETMPVDLLSMSSHKIYGPKGAGALFIRNGVSPSPVMFGGGQERGIRPSTENVPAIAGFGRAAEICSSEIAPEAARLSVLRKFLLDEILCSIPGSYLIGHPYKRLPGHICLGFDGLEGEAISLLLNLDSRGISASSGSACSSNHGGGPAETLLAMGFDPLRARGSLRISLGRFNSTEELSGLASTLAEAVSGLKSMNTRR